MLDFIHTWSTRLFASAFILFSTWIDAQPISNASYPYTSGQAVFVQSPYTSSLYTNYQYNARTGLPTRLPTYTTNTATFVQQPYATAQQTVTAYPSYGYYNRPYKESRYASPTAFPSTVGAPYPFATVNSYTSSPYTVTSQYPAYTYPSSSQTYMTTETYPYVNARQVATYPGAPVQQAPLSSPYSTTVQNTYPAAPVQYGYPTSRTPPIQPVNVVQPTPVSTSVTPTSSTVTYPGYPTNR